MSAVIEITTPVEVAGNNSVNLNPKLRQITVEEYDLMIKNGIFDTNDKIELLNGVIIEKTPKGTKHAVLNDKIAMLLIQQLGSQVVIRNQNPVWLDEFSEPEPDIVLAETPFEKYYESHPTPNEIYLISLLSGMVIAGLKIDWKAA